MNKLSISSKKPLRQEGFALILALLALMLLTSLGLSLASTTSTELQIAVNHRWSEQARYNAEAGIEFGREFLSSVPNWGTILPPARGVATGWVATATPSTAPTDALQSRLDAFGNPTRNYENWGCDQKGFGRGYGVVLDDGVTAGAPFQFTSTVGGSPLSGAFTLWIRRPVQWKADTGATAQTLQDYTGDDVLILVAEGVAPFTQFNSRSRVANRASQIVEVLLSNRGSSNQSINFGATECTTRQGQSGGSAQGTNSQACSVIDGASLIPALTGAGSLGTGNLR
jgi:hypothetical protein